MVADQHRHAVRPGGLDQPAHLVEMHAYRLLQQHRHAGFDAVQRSDDMQVVRVGDYHRLRLDDLQHLAVVGKVRHAALSGETGGLRPGIGHRAEARGGNVEQVLVMLATHDAGADQGDAQR
ncbi:hypothetical protein D9M71_541460 [compost metagenome]